MKRYDRIMGVMRMMYFLNADAWNDADRLTLNPS